VSESAPKPKVPASQVRRFPRYPLDVRITAQVFRAPETISLWGRTSELGLDGIGGTLTGELQPGEVALLELSLPLTPYPMKIRGIVRYREGLRHGFEFLALSDEQRSTVGRVCDMLAAGR